MKLSIFTTVKDPIKRGDNVRPAIESYNHLADELVIVNGSQRVTSKALLGLKVIHYYWRSEFEWAFIGGQFQRGYEACSGDVVIHADLDFIFHERDREAIRQAAQNMLDQKLPAMSFWKYQFVQPDRYNLKSRLVVMVNKRDYGDRIKFDSGGDLCQPSLDGKELKASEVQEARVPFYNYEKLTKTQAQIMDDVGRMDRAYKRYFGKLIYSTDGTNQSAYNGWLKMALGRYSKPQKEVELDEHPKFIQETIKNLKPNMWGYNAFGNLKENNYV